MIRLLCRLDAVLVPEFKISESLHHAVCMFHLQCEIEGGEVDVGTLPAFIGDDADHSIFPVTAGALDNLRAAEIDA